MNGQRVLLTERDLEVFRFVNGFRYARAKHIFEKFHVSQKFYRRLQLLTENEFLIYERIFRGMPGHYRCTKKAVDVAEDLLPSPREVVLGTYHHDMMVVDLALEMEKRTGGQWVPERRLRESSEEEGLRRFSRHYPDGLLLIPNSGKTYRIAVELEHLNRKSKKRLAGIIESYLDGSCAVGQVDRVAYFCCSEVLRSKVTGVVRCLRADRLVEVRLLSEILPGEDENSDRAKAEHI